MSTLYTGIIMPACCIFKTFFFVYQKSLFHVFLGLIFWIKLSAKSIFSTSKLFVLFLSFDLHLKSGTFIYLLYVFIFPSNLSVVSLRKKFFVLTFFQESPSPHFKILLSPLKLMQAYSVRLKLPV